MAHELDSFILKHFAVEANPAGPTALPIDRTGMVKLWRKFGYQVAVEVGVSKGRFSKTICQVNPSIKLYGIDPWNAYEGYVERKGARGQEALDRHYEEAQARLAPFNCELIKGFSPQAATLFQDGELDAVFIDGNHSFSYAVADIAAWTQKVRVGGMICGHDYWNSADGFGYKRLPIEQFIKGLTRQEELRVCQVKYAVDAWTAAHAISPFYTTAQDDFSSWFWIKGENV